MLDLCNGAFSEKTPQIFRPSLPVEYVTSISGRTDAPEVRCGLKPNYRNPRCACAPRVNYAHMWDWFVGERCLGVQLVYSFNQIKYTKWNMYVLNETPKWYIQTKKDDTYWNYLVYSYYWSVYHKSHSACYTVCSAKTSNIAYLYHGFYKLCVHSIFYHVLSNLGYLSFCFSVPSIIL